MAIQPISPEYFPEDMSALRPIGEVVLVPMLTTPEEPVIDRRNNPSKAGWLRGLIDPIERRRKELLKSGVNPAL